MRHYHSNEVEPSDGAKAITAILRYGSVALCYIITGNVIVASFVLILVIIDNIREGN